MSTRQHASATTSSGPSIDIATLVTRAEAVFGEADEARATGSLNLATVCAARANVLQRVRDTAAKKLGANAPILAALDARLAADKLAATSLTAQGNLARRPRVTAAGNESVVYGVVLDAAGKAAAGVKLALAQPKGQPLAATTTDKDGHFTLRTIAPTEAEIPAALELRLHDARHPSPVELDRGNGIVFTSVRLED